QKAQSVSRPISFILCLELPPVKNRCCKPPQHAVRQRLIKIHEFIKTKGLQTNIWRQHHRGQERRFSSVYVVLRALQQECCFTDIRTQSQHLERCSDFQLME